ncbi:hypothetical protein V5799_014687 [Amblyomma americanum]|uniref:Uncharacterized protein n=1 Tax=Amblyomma americanum TaxID=6943 RepID=A0AAQ4E2A6_AMBAM
MVMMAITMKRYSSSVMLKLWSSGWWRSLARLNYFCPVIRCASSVVQGARNTIASFIAVARLRVGQPFQQLPKRSKVVRVLQCRCHMEAGTESAMSRAKCQER